MEWRQTEPSYRAMAHQNWLLFFFLIETVDLSKINLSVKQQYCIYFFSL